MTFMAVMLNWSEALSSLSLCRLQLTWGFIVSEQPVAHPSERPAEAGSRPAELCIWSTDAAGLPSASILILMLSTSQLAGNLSEMQYIALRSHCEHR